MCTYHIASDKGVAKTGRYVLSHNGMKLVVGQGYGGVCEAAVERLSKVRCMARTGEQPWLNLETVCGPDGAVCR